MSFFRRFRMEFSLAGQLPASELALPNFTLHPWRDDDALAHAFVMHHGFCDEVDANLFFRTFCDRARCNELMAALGRLPELFRPGSSLCRIAPENLADALPEEGPLRKQARECFRVALNEGVATSIGIPVGTVQVVLRDTKTAAIHNVVVLPQFRSLGIGRFLVLQALHAAQQEGLQKITLDVTAENRRAVKFYEKLGFLRARTIFREVNF